MLKGNDVRVALAQLNSVVGDIAGNAERAIEAIEGALRGGADLVVFPELALVGYPAYDLLASDEFISANLEALRRVAAACTGVAALVGFVDRVGDARYNAAALCFEGSVLHTVRKHALACGAPLDERRYFEPGPGASVLEIHGTRVAVTIGHDLYDADGGFAAAAEDVFVLAALAAAPFFVGAISQREQALCEVAAQRGTWLAHCNLVGGQDEFVFDGRSAMIAPGGMVVARAEAFATDLLFADLASQQAAATPARLAAPASDVEDTYHALCLGVRDYTHKNGFTDVVLGVSGGLDSALLAAIATDALGAEHVHGVVMPSRYSSAGSITDSRALAAALGIDLLELSIEPPFSAMLDSLAPFFEGCEPDATEENLQARVRGMLLMALSNKFGWLVLAPGNKSELSVGYTTLYGDMVGGIAPLKDVFKTRVYELARWRNRDGEVIPTSIIEKPPSAELRPEQTDQDSLPPYEVLDDLLAGYVEGGLSRAQLVAKGHDPVTVDRVCRMVDVAEYKRRQGPLGICVAPRAFGKDRRMPVTNRYRG